MRKGTWVQRADGSFEVTEDKARGSSNINFKFPLIVLIVVILFGIWVGGGFDWPWALSAAKKIDMKITDKIANGVYNEGYSTWFTITIKNNSKLTLSSLEGELVIYNAEKQVLKSFTCYLDLYIPAGEEITLSYSLRADSSNEAAELYYSELHELSATFQTTEIGFSELQGETTLKLKPVSILELGVEKAV